MLPWSSTRGIETLVRRQGGYALSTEFATIKLVDGPHKKDCYISDIAKAKTSSPSVMAEFERRPSSYMRAVRMLASSKMSRSPAAPEPQRS